MVDGRRGKEIQRLFAQRLSLFGIGREVCESRGDDVVRLGFLRRGSAHRIQQERRCALDESQAQSCSPAGPAGFLRRGCKVAHAEREAARSEREPACQDSDNGERAGPRATRLLQWALGQQWDFIDTCHGHLLFLTTGRQVEEDVSEPRFRAIQRNVKNGEATSRYRGAAV